MGADVQLMSGEFKFLVPLAKAVEGEDGDLYVEGVASDTGLDLQGERIGIKGQESMVRWAKAGTVALGGEADHYHIAFDDDLGYLVDGHVTDKGEFFIRARLDKDNPRAVGLWRMLRKGKKLGLSVFGKITEYHVDDDGVPVIDGVELTRVMVTPTPANPRTWLEYVSKALVIEEGSEMGGEQDKADELIGGADDAAKAEWTTEYINSLPDEAFAVIEPAYLKGETEDKRARHLPHHNENVTDPDDDDTVDLPHLRNALARVNQIKPITDSISAEELREKARKHLEAHAERLGVGEAGEEAEESAPADDGEPAAKGEPTADPSEPTASAEQEPLESGAPDAAKEEPEAEQGAGAPDPRAVAKGLFRDALQQLAEEQEKWGPLLEQYERVEAISELVEVLWSVIAQVDTQAAFEELSPDEAAALLGEAIEEFKAEVATKAQAVEDDGGEPRQAAKEAVEEPQPEPQETVQPQHPAAMVARSFAEAVEMLTALDVSDEERRQAVGEVLAETAKALDEAFPAPEPEMPEWARAILAKVEALESVIRSADVGAGSAAGTGPENGDKPTLPTRKSKPPEVRPSKAVTAAKTFRDIVNQMFFGGGDDSPLLRP